VDKETDSEIIQKSTPRKLNQLSKGVLKNVNDRLLNNKQSNIIDTPTEVVILQKGNEKINDLRDYYMGEGSTVPK
jgi:hypothetical protein